MAVFQANRGPIDRKAMANAFDKTIDRINVEESKEVLELSPFFADRSTNLFDYVEAENFANFDLPVKTEDTESTPLISPTEGHKKTFTAVNFRSGYAITEDMVMAQKTPVIQRMMSGFPKAFNRKSEYAMADVLNGGFDSQTTADGAYVFSDSHSWGDAEYGGYDNLATAAGLTPASYFTAWQHFENFRDDKGHPAPQRLSKLVYPVDLHERAAILLNSDNYAGNSLNDANPFKKDAEPMSCHYLTSSTAWFAFGNLDEASKGFLCVWRMRPDFKPLSVSQNPRIITGRDGKMSFNCGAMHARNVYGNAGA